MQFGRNKKILIRASKSSGQNCHDVNQFIRGQDQVTSNYCENCTHIKELLNGQPVRIHDTVLYPEGHCTWFETCIYEPHDENDDPIPQIISKSETLRCECKKFVGKGQNSVSQHKYLV